MESYEFKYYGHTFNFEEMIVYTPNGYSKLNWNETEQTLYRLTDSRSQRLAPSISSAYLEYQVDKILLSEE